MKIIIYARVSSLEQVSGYSIAAQTDQCYEWAINNGYNVIKIYTEPGKSAKTDQRPEFQAAIQFVLAGEADAILVHRADRFARNLFDYLNYRSQLEAQEKMILSATETFFNGVSPETKLLANIIMSVAEFIAARIGQETSKGTVQKAKEGKWPGGRPPNGYKRIDKDTIIIDPEKGSLFRKAFKEFASGQYTLQLWQIKAKELGIINFRGKPLNTKAWHDLFRNIFYTGQFYWKKQLYQGDHQPLIDKSTFETVQELLTLKNSGGKHKTHFWLLSGLLWSEKYQKPMSGSQSGKNRYYRAKGPGSEHVINAADIEEKTINLLQQIQWDNENLFQAPEKIQMAIKSAPNIGLIYTQITHPIEQQEFLNTVFTKKGIVIASGGSISHGKLKKV